MPRSTDETVDPQAGIAVDFEIASLLTAIEEEKTPDRLTKLAIELQSALIDKRRGEVKN